MSSSSPPSISSNSNDKALNRKKATRLIKTRDASIENIVPAEFNGRKTEPSSFCTIGQSYSHSNFDSLAENREDTTTVIDGVIDNLTVTNPYLIQKRINLVPDSTNDSKTDVNGTNSAQNENTDENDSKRNKGFDKSRFSFL